MNKISGIQVSYTEPHNLCTPAFILSTYKTWDEACEAIRNLDPNQIFEFDAPRCDDPDYVEEFVVKMKTDMRMRKDNIPWFTMLVEVKCGWKNDDVHTAYNRRYTVRPVEIPLP